VLVATGAALGAGARRRPRDDGATAGAAIGAGVDRAGGSGTAAGVAGASSSGMRPSRDGPAVAGAARAPANPTIKTTPALRARIAPPARSSRPCPEFGADARAMEGRRAGSVGPVASRVARADLRDEPAPRVDIVAALPGTLVAVFGPAHR
jgi:hypothetical protein